ncbi:MAG: hypothetical protein ACRDPY_44785 [Streptosporangiaceae bacterium]
MFASDINDGLNALRDRISQVRPHDPVPDVDGTEPVMNHYQPALCRNSCVTGKHVPAIKSVISGSRELLSIQKLSGPQRTALQQHIGIMESPPAPAGGPGR